MNKYIKGNVVINATEKAYNTLYKAQGFEPYKEEKEVKPKKNTKKKEEADK